MPTRIATPIRIIDGDTIEVDPEFTDAPPVDAGEGLMVRILGYDVPEDGRPGHAEASAHLRRLVGSEGSQVALTYDPDHMFDAYDRLLAHVTANGADIGIAMTQFLEGRSD